ncbi:MAG: APC family permease [Candidatus Omnitrophota bacterium]
MVKKEKASIFKKIKNVVIGGERNISDPRLFHNISLVVFFAWVGLGADGLSSSCYGPEEAFLALKSHPSLGIFVALATMVTIFVISSSYSQIIELFPHGGGGYLVASKLLSPSVGMVSGCALLVDYVLTITLSVASGADALFSFLPPAWYGFKLQFAVAALFLLIILNMRGVKESVLPLVPIFLTFLFTHAILIIYTVITHAAHFGAVVSSTVSEVHSSSLELGTFGMILLILRAYSMGAGTYTGIEAVSNGIPILREPKVETAKKTMRYMSISLSILVVGLMLGYLFYNVQFQEGKTLNAVLLDNVTAGWSQPWGYIFVLVTLISEAVLLFVAAQTGFLDGPRVLGNMAQDRWFPGQFANLSERFVTQNGVLLMGISAFLLMLLSRGSVKFLVVLYSINVFMTFCLSQTGMVRHWWLVRKKAKHWIKRIIVNGIGLAMTGFILVSVVVLKFFDGGWLTIFITGSLVILAIAIKRHYKNALRLLTRLDDLASVANMTVEQANGKPLAQNVNEPDPQSKIAVIFVNGYNGLGLHTLFNIIRVFGGSFKNFFFVQVGIIDTGNFKGAEEIEELKKHINAELDRYVVFMRSQGFYAKGFSGVDVDAVEGVEKIAADIYQQYSQAVFFGGQMVFPKETFFTRMLHNYTIFAVQRKLYNRGIPLIIMPIRVS